MREFLKGLGLDKETIDSIMAEVGKQHQGLKEQIDELKKTNEETESQLKTLKENSKNAEELQKKLDEITKADEERKAQEKAKAADDILNKNISEAIGDKKFVNDFTKNAIINEIKAELKSEKNVGKSAKDLFEAFTKDKEDIFENPNKGVSTPPTGDVNKDLISENHDRELLGLDPKK